MATGLWNGSSSRPGHRNSPAHRSMRSAPKAFACFADCLMGRGGSRTSRGARRTEVTPARSSKIPGGTRPLGLSVNRVPDQRLDLASTAPLTGFRIEHCRRSDLALDISVLDEPLTSIVLSATSACTRRLTAGPRSSRTRPRVAACRRSCPPPQHSSTAHDPAGTRSRFDHGPSETISFPTSGGRPSRN
jgi:hypothetical protein